MAESTDLLVQLLNLLYHGVRRAVDCNVVSAEILHAFISDGVSPPAGETPGQEVGVKRTLHIARRRAELRFRFIVSDVPEYAIDEVARLLLGLADRDKWHEGELVVSGRWQSLVAAIIANTHEHLCQSFIRGEEHGEGEATFNRAARMAEIAAARSPDWRMRLLIGPRPNVDLALMQPLALVVKWSVFRRPRFDDQVDRFPQAFRRLGRVCVGSEQLVWDAAHEAAVEPAV